MLHKNTYLNLLGAVLLDEVPSGDIEFLVALVPQNDILALPCVVTRDFKSAVVTRPAIVFLADICGEDTRPFAFGVYGLVTEVCRLEAVRIFQRRSFRSVEQEPADKKLSYLLILVSSWSGEGI